MDETKKDRQKYYKEYREANIEKIRENDRKRYHANKEKMKSKGKKYYEENKDKRKDYRFDYYQDNKKKFAKKIRCECGAVVRPDGLKTHTKTKKHQKLIQDKNT